MQDYLPPVRATTTLKRKLQLLSERSVSKNLSDHIRMAVEQYIDNNWTDAMQAEFDAEQDEVLQPS